MELFDSITLEEFYNVLNGRYKKTKVAIADDLNIDVRTLSRWIISNKYKSLSEGKYFQIFKSLESECKKNDDDIVEVLVEHFGLPSEYFKMDYNDLKQIIIFNLDNKLVLKPKNSSSKDKETQYSSKQFLQDCLDHKDDIEKICIAFQSGWTWTDNREIINLLEQLNNSGIIIQLIANPDEVIKKIAMEMRDSNLIMFYKGFNETLSRWHEWESYLDNFSLRVSEYPILRIFHAAIYKNGTKKAIFYDYVYEYAPNFKSFIQLSNKNSSLAIFMREFNFLWDKAKEYSDWFNTLPKQEELMSSGNYVLLYLSHKENLDDIIDSLSDFTISALSIEEDNKVKLYTNIPNTIAFTVDNKQEYTYQGKLKLTRNNIFMSLYDKTEQKQINISLRRPLYDIDRFLGIMTTLSPSGQPFALKCACIDSSIFSKLNISQLKHILSNNQKGKDSLMILGEQDINDFYSDQILTNNN